MTKEDLIKMRNMLTGRGNSDSGLTGYPSIDRPWEIGASFSKKHPIIPNINIYNLIKLKNIGNMDKNAVDCIDLNATYRQLIEDSKTISKSLMEFGIKSGDVISIALPNSYQGLALYLACNRIGAIATFLDFRSTQAEINEYINKYESPIFVGYNKSEEGKRIIEDTTARYIISLDKNNFNSLNINGNYHSTTKDDVFDFHSLGSVASEGKKRKVGSHGKKEDSLILYTSGSTGKSKSVLLTNENILSAMIYMKNTGKASEAKGDKVLATVPFSYPYGLVTSVISTLLWDKEAILLPTLNGKNVSYFYSKNPGIVFGTPAFLDMTLKNVPEGQDLSSVNYFISGGDFLSEANALRGMEFFRNHNSSAIVGAGFGNAEMTSVGTNTLGVPLKLQTSGKLITGCDAIVIDPITLEEKKYNEPGLLCTSGKHMFREYYKDKENTDNAFVFINGKKYFKTGTIGYIDEEGYFTPVSRDSRYYIMSLHYKVYCDKVQNIISQLPEIKDCAVVKVPDDEQLFVNKAYIVLNDNVQPSEEMKQFIFDCLKGNVSECYSIVEKLKDYEIPTYIEFVNEFPRIRGSEKINYTLLEEDALKDSNTKTNELTLKKDSLY